MNWLTRLDSLFRSFRGLPPKIHDCAFCGAKTSLAEWVTPANAYGDGYPAKDTYYPAHCMRCVIHLDGGFESKEAFLLSRKAAS